MTIHHDLAISVLNRELGERQARQQELANDMAATDAPDSDGSYAAVCAEVVQLRMSIQTLTGQGRVSEIHEFADRLADMERDVRTLKHPSNTGRLNEDEDGHFVMHNGSRVEVKSVHTARSRPYWSSPDSYEAVVYNYDQFANRQLVWLSVETTPQMRATLCLDLPTLQEVIYEHRFSH